MSSVHYSKCCNAKVQKREGTKEYICGYCGNLVTVYGNLYKKYTVNNLGNLVVYIDGGYIEYKKGEFDDIAMNGNRCKTLVVFDKKNKKYVTTVTLMGSEGNMSSILREFFRTIHEVGLDAEYLNYFFLLNFTKGLAFVDDFKHLDSLEEMLYDIRKVK